MENTLTPLVDVIEGSISDQQSVTSLRRDNDKAMYNDSSDKLVTLNSIEKLFPSPGVLIRDIYELFKANKPTRERAAVLNYIKLLIQK